MSLERLLKRQHDALTTLHELLHEEQALLLARAVDGPALNAVAERKQHELTQVDQLDRARRAGLRKLGYSEDAPGAAKAADDLACTGTWLTVRDLAAAIAHLNQVNGTLIYQRMSHNMRALELLTEMTSRTPYGEDGRLRSRSGQLSSSA